MRYASVFMLLGLTATVVAAADAEVPYTAFVRADNAAVRSGPAKVHYPTTYLRRGAKVEVYRHDPGGWLAIRPPRGSFSLVPAKYLKMADEPGIAHVNEASIAALVGTDESEPAELMWQVQLKQNEAVELLGVSTDRVMVGNTKETWYKIAPPAGEFRWIHEQNVTRDPDSVVAEADDAATSQTQPVASSSSGPASEAANNTWDDGFVARKKRPSTEAENDTNDVPGVDRQSDQILIPQPTPTSAAESDLLNQIGLLDVELSLMVAGDEKSWRTGELKERGEKLFNQASNNLERGRARLLLNRIDEFHELENRYKEIRLAASPDDLKDAAVADKPDRLVVEEAAEIGTGLREKLNQPVPENAGTKFDGTGYLMPVHSKRSDVPPFALVDGTGRVVQYVTPAPGVNLHRYRKLEVGVFGQRGFVSTLQTPHVTAQRIIVLERHR